jgi:hypothetical protein
MEKLPVLVYFHGGGFYIAILSGLLCCTPSLYAEGSISSGFHGRIFMCPPSIQAHGSRHEQSTWEY